MLAVVVAGLAPLGILDGETASTGLEATILDVFGEKRGALVLFGSANRLTAAALGFFEGDSPFP